MRKFVIGAFALVVSFTAAQAAQWDDLAQYENSLPSNPNFTGSKFPATDFAFSVNAYNCASPKPAYHSFVDPNNNPNCTTIDSPLFNLNNLARQSDLMALGTQVNGVNTAVTSLQASFASLSAQFAATNAQFLQALQQQTRDTDSGVAAALAMAGTADLQSDEHYAVSFNVGTFGGQTAFAGGGAARIDDHLSLNAGLTVGVNGGPVGARAGIRFGW